MKYNKNGKLKTTTQTYNPKTKKFFFNIKNKNDFFNNEGGI